LNCRAFVHVPGIGAAPPLDWAETSRLQWTAFFMASTLAGSAWIVASALRTPSQRPGHPERNLQWLTS